MEKLFKQVFIKSENDLPKKGEYDTNIGKLSFDGKLWKGLVQTRNITDFLSYEIDWYLLPVPESPEAEEIQVVIDKIKEECNHYVPFYAYGDNEAGCNFAERLLSIFQLCSQAEELLSHLTTKPKVEDDLIEKVKELLYEAYYKHGDRVTSSDDIHRWVEEKTGELSEYYKSVK